MNDFSLLAQRFPALEPSWQGLLATETSQPYMMELADFLAREQDVGSVVYPPQQDVFRALELTPFPEVRVVVLGQDPYHGERQANGLAFAVHQGVKIPPSLRNIYKELSADLKCPPPQETSLLGWARQGVLLLNTVLTVRAHEAFSHRGRGWERFTEKVIESLNAHPEPLVFMLWGAPAQEKAALVRDPRHLILRAPHPSPLSAHRGFFGCGHFSKANEFLQRVGRPMVDWRSVS
jgi:uracil-DNA glycosylase